ncbi:MAG: hypothetical protein JW860_14510 [Sedimentisphaerales bacterium]|nr:hypothetical protein [Sedimentisphaerales bacterium]
MKKWGVLIFFSLLLFGMSTAWGDSNSDLQAQIKALQEQVAKLEAQQNQKTYQERNAELLKDMMTEVSGSPYHPAADTGITAGYDKRFFIKSTDDQFLLEFDTRLQFRHTYLKADDCGSSNNNSSASNFELERAKLFLSGHVMNNVKYKITLDGDDDSTNNAVLIQEYEVSYGFSPDLAVRVGRYKGPFSKQEITSSGAQMMVDRSLANEVFNISRTTGVELVGDLPMSDTSLNYRLGMYNGFKDEKHKPFTDYDNNPAVGGRIVLPLLGASTKDFANESDLMMHENPVMQLGASVIYNNSTDEETFIGGDEDNYRILVRDVNGDVTSVPAYGETTMFGLDLSYKHQGVSIILEGFLQHADLNGSLVDDAMGAGVVDSYKIDNYGWYAQAGVFVVPKTFELACRVGGVCIDDGPDAMEYAGGWNWYLSGQDLKLSMDCTYIDDMLPIDESSPNLYGSANSGDSLLMVRTQLQFQF